MSAERPPAFGATVERARRRVKNAPAGLGSPAAPGFANPGRANRITPALSRWAAGIIVAGALLALAWIVALVAAPDRIAAALAPAPGTTPPALAVAVAASPTPTESATPPPANSLTPTWTPFPTATKTPAASPTPSVSPTPTVALIPSRLVIPAIGVDTSVVAVGWHLVSRDGDWQTEWEVPSGAAGWHNTSARPGQAGNTVLSGHHNIEGLVFRDLFKLRAGAEVILYAGPLEFHYRVVESMIVQEQGASAAQRQENARWIGPFPDERVTLVTCWPADNNTHRVIVVAKPVYR